jgi:hypothetical protein
MRTCGCFVVWLRPRVVASFFDSSVSTSCESTPLAGAAPLGDTRACDSVAMRPSRTESTSTLARRLMWKRS